MMILGMPFLLETTTLEASAALCQQLGLQFVELNANFPACQLHQLRAEELLRLSEQYGIFFTMHIEEECDPLSFNPYVRDAWLKTIETAAALARTAGMPVLNMHLPRGVYITQPERKAFLYAQCEEEYKRAVLHFRDFCTALLQGSDVRIGVENTAGFAPHERQAIEWLLESPVFGLTLDIGHNHAQGNMDWPFYEQHADRLIHMHGHDTRDMRDHLVLGEGDIDLRQRFAWAAEHHARIVLEVKTIAALTESVRRFPQYSPESR